MVLEGLCLNQRIDPRLQRISGAPYHSQISEAIAAQSRTSELIQVICKDQLQVGRWPRLHGASIDSNPGHIKSGTSHRVLPPE
jgi:hypothetical protein